MLQPPLENVWLQYCFWGSRALLSSLACHAQLPLTPMRGEEGEEGEQRQLAVPARLAFELCPAESPALPLSRSLCGPNPSTVVPPSLTLSLPLFRSLLLLLSLSLLPFPCVCWANEPRECNFLALCFLAFAFGQLNFKYLALHNV